MRVLFFYKVKINFFVEDWIIRKERREIRGDKYYFVFDLIDNVLVSYKSEDYENLILIV